MYYNNAFGKVGVHPIPPDQILFTVFFPRLHTSNDLHKDAFSHCQKLSGGGNGCTGEGEAELAAVSSSPAAHHKPLPFMELIATS